eukprot:TRINITY_DN65383_c0_g1_i1.p1 TRINITY_DN65383_c0_g1~~TRINITY_DN65383_c0_g1_i1.p1  ORF type:complete len:305 (+),score=40.01 TRINITY_DN65383_c0_g1_i1:51-965(+)
MAFYSSDPLLRFGYPCSPDCSKWEFSLAEVSKGARAQWPKLEVDITGHEERDGHTWYMIKCTIDPVGRAPKEWKLERRLKQIREDWHDVIKYNCGWDGYNKQLPDHFASRGGLKGTTRALNEWAKGVARAMNMGKATPSVVRETLKFLEVTSEPVEPTDVFLLRFGFACKADNKWFKFEGAKDVWPVLTMEVRGFEEQNGQTVFAIHACLKPSTGDTELTWISRRSLEHIRHAWSGVLSTDYDYAVTIPSAGYFADTEDIAGGIAEWVMELARGINERIVPPGALALTLRFLDAPAPSGPRGRE